MVFIKGSDFHLPGTVCFKRKDRKPTVVFDFQLQEYWFTLNFFMLSLNTVCHTIDFYYLSTLCYWHLLIIKSSLCISFLWYDQIKSSLARVLIRPFICTCHSTVSRKIVPFKNACLSISYPSFIWSRNPLPYTYFPKKMRK